MNMQSDSAEREGILRIVDGIKSEEKALALKAGLEDLPGVHVVQLSGDNVEIYCDAELATEQQFYEAVKVVGFKACDFHWAA